MAVRSDNAILEREVMIRRLHFNVIHVFQLALFKLNDWESRNRLPDTNVQLVANLELVESFFSRRSWKLMIVGAVDVCTIFQYSP